jgi:hypothetical protein
MKSSRHKQVNQRLRMSGHGRMKKLKLVPASPVKSTRTCQLRSSLDTAFEHSPIGAYQRCAADAADAAEATNDW